MPSLSAQHEPRARVVFVVTSSRNPGVAGFSTNELMNLTLGAAVGGIGSKYAAQVALGSNNSGIMATSGKAFHHRYRLGRKQVVGKSAATGVVAGGGAALALRIFNDTMGAPAVVPAGPVLR